MPPWLCNSGRPAIFEGDVPLLLQMAGHTLWVAVSRISGEAASADRVKVGHG